MTEGSGNVSFPLTELVDQVVPLVEERLEAKFAGMKVAANKRRSRLDSFEVAVSAVIKAVERVEKARNSRDETPSINALVAAAAGLRSARLNYVKGN
ncbi:hypothetical protein [Rhizobium sp. NFR12]|uniref:hypothetical protein n=1 Tax=Rhizobium sp. NFR12 TaxID=1566261 RepID=UPI0008A80550|nr:hypothetical protein [Rhizobium sp. NFR12]SEH22563.1 hypothetical protein SAMN03159407_1200 [Rhizobium sp. NFR12]